MRLTPSMVVAAAALFVSLSGIGTAAYTALAPKNTVNTAAIVDGSIRLKDIHPTAIRALEGQTGDTGPAGPAGPIGPTGPAGQNGLNGGFDPSKVGVVTGGETFIGQYSVGSSTATCPDGTKVVAGGYAGTADVFISAPLGNAWQVSGATTYSGGARVRAYAICAAP